MPTLTSNFNFKKPLVNNQVDADLWGAQLNANWDSADSYIATKTETKTADYSVLSSDFGKGFFLDGSSNTVTVTLPPTADIFNGYRVGFRAANVDNLVTIAPNAGQDINGESSVELSSVGNSATFVFDGTNWSNFTPTSIDVNNAIEEQKVTLDFATIKEIQPNGTNAQVGVVGTFITRNLNTLDDPNSIVTSLSSNQFTLPAGKYFIDFLATNGGLNNTNDAVAVLYNVTDATNDIISMNQAGGGSSTRAVPILGIGIVDIADTKVFEIRHRVATAQHLGKPASFGIDEVYSVVKIQKI